MAHANPTSVWRSDLQPENRLSIASLNSTRTSGGEVETTLPGRGVARTSSA
jgi:hypothetical protein